MSDVNQHILEKIQIVSGFVPVDMQTASNPGDWVNLALYGRCTVVLFKAIGTDNDDPAFTLQQATDVAGTGVKALNFTRYDYKIGTLTAVGTFTTATQAAGNTLTIADSAQFQAIIVLDFKAEDLDVANGFNCLRATIADTGSNAQLGCMLYLMHEPRFALVPLPSAIV